jgi:ATP-dependent Clp protease, protease subunit
MRERLNKIFAAATGQPLARIEEDTNRNFWLDAQSAIEYGVAGKIVKSMTELK